jgi:hypothetical protein
MEPTDARLAYVGNIHNNRFRVFLTAFGCNRERQVDFALVPKESTPTSGMLRYRSA